MSEHTVTDVYGRDAKDVRKVNHFTDNFWFRATLKRYGKLLDKQPNRAAAALAANAYCTALQVLLRLEGLAPERVSLDSYLFCRDEGYRFISRQFEMALDMAATEPEKFIFKLHSFYNNLSAKLRKGDGIRAFGQFAHLFLRLRYTKNDIGADPNVVLAYSDLILQTFEYLHPVKLNLDNSLVGCMLDGTPMVSDVSYSYLNLASLDLFRRVTNGESCDFPAICRSYGLDVPSEEAATELGRQQRVFENMRGHMFPLINEYTYDILPPRDFLRRARMTAYRMEVDLEALSAALLHRRRTIPSNGVRFQIDDPLDFWKEVLLREIVFNREVYLLYRVDTSEGSFCGYYLPSRSFLYSPFSEYLLNHFEGLFRRILLYLYACAVLDSPDYTPEQFPERCLAVAFPLRLTMSPLAGKPRSTYPKAPGTAGASRAEDGRFRRKEVFINGLIRRLPAGQKASQRAKDFASEMGYVLGDDETYVMPFYKEIYVLNDGNAISGKSEDPNVNGET